MKKTAVLLLICAMVMVASACKRNQWKGLEYYDTTAGEWFQASVKKTGGESVLWFQVFDQLDNKGIIDSYKNAKGKVEDYPAKIFENKWIWLLVNDRIEIRLIADDKSPEFRDTDKLKKFIESFDLSGMKKVTGPKLKGEDLGKFKPELGKK